MRTSTFALFAVILMISAIAIAIKEMYILGLRADYIIFIALLFYTIPLNKDYTQNIKRNAK